MTRRCSTLLSSLVAVVLAGLGAGSASAATCDVLTYGSVCNGSGTNNVANGDILTAGLYSGTSAVFSTGFVTITCSSAELVGTVTANPVAPGTATLGTTSFSLAGCTSNLGAVTTKTIADGSASVSSSNVVALKGEAFSFTWAGTTCEYEFANAVADTATFSNANSTLAMSAAPLTLVSGGGFCSSTGTETYSLGPVVDAAHSNARVFVNS